MAKPKTQVYAGMILANGKLKLLGDQGAQLLIEDGIDLSSVGFWALGQALKKASSRKVALEQLALLIASIDLHG